MCILFLYTDPNPKKGCFRLILANNRDEYYARPAESLSFSPETCIIGGKDLEPGREGGMWLGASLKRTDSRRMKIAALLNLPGEERHEESLSRGCIVTNYLEGDWNSPGEYIDHLREEGEYKPFNSVMVELNENETVTSHFSSVMDKEDIFKGRQILGFGNCTIDVPIVKVTKGRERFSKIIEKYNSIEMKEILVKELDDLLKWRERHLPDLELKRRKPEAFEVLSSVFVEFEEAGYGTRTHSIVLVDFDWNLEFIEVTMEGWEGDISKVKWKTEVFKMQI